MHICSANIHFLQKRPVVMIVIFFPIVVLTDEILTEIGLIMESICAHFNKISISLTIDLLWKYNFSLIISISSTIAFKL